MCIYAQKKNESVLKKISENWQQGIGISSIVLAELEYGVQASMQKEKNEIALIKFLSVVDILPFDEFAAAEYGKICASLRSKGTPIGNMDMLISAHAKSLGLTIVTNNVREFDRVSGLCVENWYK